MTRRALASFAAALAVTFSAAVATAGDYVVGGKELTLRAGTGGALSLQLRDSELQIPAPGTPDDPSIAGLVVTLFGWGSGGQASFLAAPGGEWRVRTAPIATYQYARRPLDPGSTSVALATLRAGKALRVRAKSGGLPLSSPEGAVGVRVQMGETRICALFDPPAVRRDAGGRFVARDADVAAIANCDDASLGGATCAPSGLACGGTCPADWECAGGAGLGCTCVSPHQPCGGTAPACNGECPAGEECADIGGTPYSSCGCLPVGSTPCGGVYPSCGDGDCPAGTTCFVSTFTCCGGAQISNCACSTGPPPPPCGGTCPAGWTCVGPRPGIPEFCLPPFCSGGTGAPVCDGGCAAGTECRDVGSLCLCLTPCIGGDPYPTCGGTCADPGWTCAPVQDGCACAPPA